MMVRADAETSQYKSLKKKLRRGERVDDGHTAMGSLVLVGVDAYTAFVYYAHRRIRIHGNSMEDAKLLQCLINHLCLPTYLPTYLYPRYNVLMC